MHIFYERLLVSSIYHTSYEYSFFVFASPSLLFGPVSLLLLSLIQFLSCCCCCCWCPPLRCYASPWRCCLYASCSNKLFFFSISAEQNVYGELQRQESLFLCHRRSLEQVDGEDIYAKSGHIGNFLIDISRRWFNELKRGWLFWAHYIPGHVKGAICYSANPRKSSPRRKSKKRAIKHMLFRTNKRHTYKKCSNIWHHPIRLYQTEVPVTYQNT